LACAREPGAVPCQRDADPRCQAVAAGVERAAGQRPGAGPASPVARRPGADALELGGLRRPLEDLRRGAALAEDLAGRSRVALAVEVAAADLDGAHAQRLADSVELDLGGELRLGRPEAAERAVGRRV